MYLKEAVDYAKRTEKTAFPQQKTNVPAYTTQFKRNTYDINTQ